MIKLADILKEVEQESELDLSDLKKLPDLIGAELEKASEEQNESIIGAAALVLAVPGMLNAISKVVQVIVKKSGIDLKKRNNPAWYKTLDTVTAKVDGYLDTPFKVMLRPFIQDQVKRDKTAKFLKAITLASMAIMGAVDISKLQSTASAIKDLAGQSGSEIIQAVGEHSIPKLTGVVKNFITGLK